MRSDGENGKEKANDVCFSYINIHSTVRQYHLS